MSDQPYLVVCDQEGARYVLATVLNSWPPPAHTVVLDKSDCESDCEGPGARVGRGDAQPNLWEL